MNEKSRPEATLNDLGGSTYKTTANPEISHSDAAERFRNCYAVLVRGKSVRRHLYLNLAAAERVVNRARARGDQADLVLVQLVPVDDRKLDRTLRRPVGTDDMLRTLDGGGAL